MNATIPLAPDIHSNNRRPVAPLWHTVGLLLILALITNGGVRTHGTTAKVGPATNLVQLYLIVIAGEWALVFYIWRGIRRSGVTLRELIGGNWSDAREFGRNFVIAVLFWFVWEDSARLHLLFGHSSTPNVTAMLPRSAVQIVLWCLVSCTAGFCEEVLYCGYLQHQFAAWTGSAPAAIAIQAVIFGASHGYQGTKQMVIISVLVLCMGFWPTGGAPSYPAWPRMFGPTSMADGCIPDGIGPVPKP